MTPGERSMPIIDVYWDAARRVWTFEDASGYAPVEGVDVVSTTRLVRAHFPGSAIRWIRENGAPHQAPAVDPPRRSGPQSRHT